jgi:hypothetical protein
MEDQTQKKIPLSSLTMRKKAKKLYQHFSESGESSGGTAFLASEDWFENFKKRFNFQNVKLVGESASADFVAAESLLDELRKLIMDKGYLPEQVFNADETGLFWKRMPSRTYLAKSDKSAPGFKAAKDRRTLLFCVKASGHMIKQMVVYKSLNPRALKGKNKEHLPVHWKANKKA